MDEKELLELGYKKYEGEKLDVFFNLELCQHSGYCIHGHKEVFDLTRKPWIKVDAAAADKVKSIIDECPSGALKYIVKD